MKHLLALLALVLLPQIAEAQKAYTKNIYLTPAVTASSAYSTGQVIGGLLTFQGTQAGIVVDAAVLEIDQQSVVMELWLFNAKPSVIADKGTFTLSDADYAKQAGYISFPTANIASDTNGSVHYVAAQGVAVRGPIVNGQGTFYGYLVNRGTPTWSTTSSVTVKVGMLSD